MAKEKMTLDKLAQITAAGFSDLRTELKSDISDLRTELKSDIKDIKEEISLIHKDTGNIERIQRAEIGRADRQDKRITRLEQKVV